MKARIKKIKDWLGDWLGGPIKFFLGAALLVGAFLAILDYYYLYKICPSGIPDLLVEAHGLFYDLIVFGIILTLYERTRSKKERIERLREEINDYLGWDEKEATYRIVGNIKRLNKEGVNEIYLKGAYLSRASLFLADLSGADLLGASLLLADLSGADLSGADLSGADLQGADLQGANLSKTIIAINKLDTINSWINSLKEKNVIGAEEISAKYEIYTERDKDNNTLYRLKIKTEQKNELP
mgnify:CR=1 FL=1